MGRYKLKLEIENKLFNGVIIPTAIESGYDFSNQLEIVSMMETLCKKYHSMDTEQRAMLISRAEKNIQDQINNLSKDEQDDEGTNEG